MPIKKQDATRALELLEEYHRQLNSPADIQLRSAIERVIKIFKSKLFNALLEIQEFYEATLLDDSKSIEQKTMETMKVAERWANSQGLAAASARLVQQQQQQQQQLIHQQFAAAPASSSERDFELADYSGSWGGGVGSRNNGGDGCFQHARRNTPSPPPPPPPLPLQLGASNDASPSSSTAPPPASTFEVTLERSGVGFGFSIAGGTDAPAPAAAAEDPRIRVTRLVPGGAADGRLAVGDALLRVNGVDVSCVTHAEAVEALKLAGSRLRLLVLRGPAPPPPPPAATASASAASSVVSGELQREIRVLLNKTVRGLGFSIAGGMHNEHLPGDSGIFITKLIDGGAAQLDGRIAVGDRLVSVNGASLRCVTHEEAVAALKRTGQEVLLSVVKPTPDQLAILIGMEEEAEAAEAAEAAVVNQGEQPQQQQQQHQQFPIDSAALEFAPDRRRNRLSLLLLLPKKRPKDNDLISADSFIYAAANSRRQSWSPFNASDRHLTKQIQHLGLQLQPQLQLEAKPNQASLPRRSSSKRLSCLFPFGNRCGGKPA